MEQKMMKKSYQAPPLDDTERRIIILAKLYQREHRSGIPWRLLRRQTGLSHRRFRLVMLDLRSRGLMVFSRSEHSTFASPKGVREALRNGGPIED